MQPDQRIDPEADDADLDEQRHPVAPGDAAEGDGVKGEVPVEVPEADLLEQSASIPLDDDDLLRG